MALRELASSEMLYVNQLRSAIRHGLLPAYRAFAKEEGNGDDVKRQTFERILNLCSEVWQQSCISAGAFGRMSTHGAVMEVATLFSSLQPMQLYAAYCIAASDSVANGTFNHLPILRFVDENVLKAKCLGVVNHADGPADALQRLVDLPLSRMANYEAYSQRLSFLSYKGGAASAELARQGEEWMQVTAAHQIAVAEAAITNEFWEDFPGARKQFATPARRVIKHSKEAPLHTKGLLSGSTWFLLFNDAFVMSQMFGTKEMPLSTLWVQDLHPKTLTFTIVTPLETLEVYANNQTAKASWINAIVRCICKSVSSHDPVTQRAQMSRTVTTAFSGAVPLNLDLRQLERRKAEHPLRDHYLYGNSMYSGDMHVGKLVGYGARF
jgi:hypothetical protein